MFTIANHWKCACCEEKRLVLGGLFLVSGLRSPAALSLPSGRRPLAHMKAAQRARLTLTVPASITFFKRLAKKTQDRPVRVP
jgi:hypothetical protein